LGANTFTSIEAVLFLGLCTSRIQYPVERRLSSYETITVSFSRSRPMMVSGISLRYGFAGAMPAVAVASAGLRMNVVSGKKIFLPRIYMTFELGFASVYVEPARKASSTTSAS